MSRTEVHHKLYFLGAVALAMAMPLSHFVMGLAILLLVLNWIAEWNWHTKIERLRENRQGLLFAAFYVVYAIGLIHTTDWGAAGKEMLGKLPFLFAPILVITSKPFKSNELRCIFSAFILATLFGCIWNFIYAQTHTLDNYREMSRFIDHIRFGLCVVMSVVFSIHNFDTVSDFAVRKNIRYIYLVSSVLLLGYLFYCQTLSGIVIILVIAVCYFVHLIVNKADRRAKRILVCVTALLLTLAIGYTAYITYDYFHVKDSAPDTSALTASGRPYTFEEKSMLENGHYVGHYVCGEELATAWITRSDTAYDSIALTLIRYLNSLGLRKDSAAVMQLSDEDIRHIEQKTANAYYVRKGHLRQALYETYFGIALYKEYGISNGSSMLQRVELWRATWEIVRRNWLFGVGIGNQRTALGRQLELQQSPLAEERPIPGSHNQYLTYWMGAGVIPLAYFCFLLVYPYLFLRKRVTFLYFALITTLSLSILVEDTLDAFPTCMLFTTFVPILLFNRTVDH